MRSHWRDWSRLAAWLGVIALGLNAPVPIHLAFDLAEALAPAHHGSAAPADLGRQILGFLCGHEADSDHHHHDKPGSHHGCPVCAAVTTLAALALPTIAALPLPTPIDLRLDAVAIAAAPPIILAAAYRSRAPPIA